MNKAMQRLSRNKQEITLKGGLIVTILSLLLSCLAIPSMSVSAKVIENDESLKNGGLFLESLDQQEETQAPVITQEPPIEPTLLPTLENTPLPGDNPTFTSTPEAPVPTEEDTEIPTDEPTMTSTGTATVTSTPTISSTPIATNTTTITRTRTITSTFTITRTRTITNTRTITGTPTKTLTRTITVTKNTATITPTSTVTRTRTITRTSSFTPTKTKTPTYFSTLTFTKTTTPTPTITPTETETITPTLTNSASPTASPTITSTPTSGNVLVHIIDTDGNPRWGNLVYVYSGNTNIGNYGYTDMWGNLTVNLPNGNYRFMSPLNESNFWSSEENACVVPQCTTVTIVVSKNVTISVKDTDNNPVEQVDVYVFDGNKYIGITRKSCFMVGQVTFTLPLGNYRFRVDVNGTQFWSGAENTCPIPGCLEDTVIVTKPITINVKDTENNPVEGVKLYAFDGTTYKGYSKVTSAEGEASFTLPQGNYRFRADLNGAQFWTGANNTCPIPGCLSDSITVTKPVTVTVKDTDNNPVEGISLYVFDGTTYKGYSKVTSGEGEASFTLPQGNYRFRADLNGTQFWSGADNTCLIPGCLSDSIIVTKPVTVTVKNTDDNPVEGISLYAFDGTSYKGFSRKTGVDGQASFTLPQGNYRFRADLNGTQFWSGANNTCAIPGCQTDNVVVTYPFNISVRDTEGIPMSGISVYAFNNASYTGYSSKTDPTGVSSFTLPIGSYRFRADFNKTQFWSSTENACSVPGCTGADVTVTKPVTVSVKNSDDTPMANLNVYAFDGTTYKGYSGISDANGNVTLTLPLGNYRFRVDFNGTHFWSGAADTCTVAGCVSDSVIVSKPLTLTISSTNNNPVENIHVYAFDGTTYTGYTAITNNAGQAQFTLPFGNYRFRADTPSQYWSGTVNTCSIPGCESVMLSIP